MDYLLGPSEIDGLNLMRGLRVRFPKVRLLVMSALHTPAVVALVMRRGAHGFIGKDLDTARLPDVHRPHRYRHRCATPGSPRQSVGRRH